MSCAPTLIDALRSLAGDRPITFVTEWLGYLPFGQYCWIELDGLDVTAQLPAFDSGDLERLVADGALIEIERHVANDTDSRVTYRFGRK